MLELMKDKREPTPKRHRDVGPLRYRTIEVARLAGVTTRTIYNWLKDDRLGEPLRDINGYRMWTPEQAAMAMRLARPRSGQEDA